MGRAWRSVHPHVRGEYIQCVEYAPPENGSPPRAWGRHAVPLRTSSISRFTPTCVGSIADGHAARILPSVHPRVRGEHVRSSMRLSLPSGSSPHAWGTSHQARRASRHDRFTPTCVGNIHPPPSSGCSRPVHPHVRGEDCKVDLTDLPDVGSPPRAWGRCLRADDGVDQVWFIPTCVGNMRTR